MRDCAFLRPGIIKTVELLAEIFSAGQVCRVPAQMLASDPDAGVDAVKFVQRMQVFGDQCLHLLHRRGQR